MSPRVVALALLTVVLLLAPAVGDGYAREASTPFYLVPTPTTECQNVGHCEAVAGPWVVVPAHGEATFLMECSTRRGFVVGGTDARASSRAVRVWYDDALGAPIGSSPETRVFGAVLLFHASAENGREGSFQPILGCVSLPPASKIATVSIVVAEQLPGTPSSAPVNLRAEEVELSQPELEHLIGATTVERCPTGETLVGSWSALAFNTTNPPDLSFAADAHISTTMVGNAVRAHIQVAPPLLQPLAPQTFAQIGAMCAP